MTVIVPEELVALVRARRIIPFVGAGLSAGLGLPNWEDLLREVCGQLEDDVDFDALLKDTNNDLLQVAEYLYLRHDKQIGPIRHAVTRGLSRQTNPVLSGAHVELVNLGAPQIYTTNYDDLVEETFRKLSLPVMPVVLPKDVALADNKRTQVVKYHGDLRHENTLVLTESAYYKRLDFESPMDLKFRSDLLGKSVLFMGYSFRDINIRIIWFKLMEMIKDIPESDRTPSYIVRAQPNRALEELYRAVGLRTIILTDKTAQLSRVEQTRLHADFLMELVDRAETRPAGITTNAAGRPRRSPVFYSAARLERLEGRIERLETEPARRGIFRGSGYPVQFILQSRNIPTLDSIPEALRDRAAEVYRRLISLMGVVPESVAIAKAVLELFGPSPEITMYFANVVASAAMQEVRAEVLADKDLDWAQVWGSRLKADVLSGFVDRLETEIGVHLREEVDEDLAYVIDVVKRIQSGELATSRDFSKVRDRIEELLKIATKLYPAVADYDPEAASKPDPSMIIENFERGADFEEKGDTTIVMRRGKPTLVARDAAEPRP